MFDKVIFVGQAQIPRPEGQGTSKKFDFQPNAAKVGVGCRHQLAFLAPFRVSLFTFHFPFFGFTVFGFGFSVVFCFQTMRRVHTYALLLPKGKVKDCKGGVEVQIVDQVVRRPCEPCEPCVGPSESGHLSL